MINFCSFGKLGDFIHSLYVVKNICEQRNEKANLYMGGGGDEWTFGEERAYKELYPIVMQQSYIKSFSILPLHFNEPIINLNDWRKEAATTHAETGRYNKCWTELLSGYYGFEIPKDYAWMEVKETDENVVGKIIIHRSKRHHAQGESLWNEVTINGLTLFATTDITEWEQFQYKGHSQPYILNSLTEWITAIASCKQFIGNQSAGFAIASAFDKNRIVELYPDVAPFYIKEKKYSKNINYIL